MGSILRDEDNFNCFIGVVAEEYRGTTFSGMLETGSTTTGVLVGTWSICSTSV